MRRVPPVRGDAGAAAAVVSLEGSEDASLYEPPAEDEPFSEGYHSFGDTDSLGSAGNLVTGVQANWSTLQDEGWSLDDPM